MLDLTKAINYAAYQHREQVRDGSNTPYINHPIRVMNLVAEHSTIDEIVLIGAVLHDVVEDTSSSFYEIQQLFGIEVRELLVVLTDPYCTDKDTRRETQLARLESTTVQGAKAIKCADKISNCEDLLLGTSGRTRQQIDEYFEFSLELFRRVACHETIELEMEFLELYAEQNTF